MCVFVCASIACVLTRGGVREELRERGELGRYLGDNYDGHYERGSNASEGGLLYSSITRLIVTS